MISTLKKLQAKKAAQENNGGFTLIELLIVIVVLGILAAVVVFSLGGVAGSSAVAACQADGATINTAMAALQAQSPGTTPTGGSAGNLVPTYIQSWPNNYQHYTFSISSAGTLEVIASSGTAATADPTTTTDLGFKNAGWTAWSGSQSCGSSGANVK